MAIIHGTEANGRVAVNGTKKSPLLVMTAAPATGHTAPTVHIARELIKRGFEVVFLSSLEFKAGIERIGAEFREISGFWPPGTLEMRDRYPVGLPKLLFDIEKVFIDSFPERTATMRAVLEEVRERDPERSVVIVAETISMAVMPFMHGAALPKGYKEFPKVINVNVVPLLLGSIDTGPFGMGLPPDTTESGRARNLQLTHILESGPFSGVVAHQKKILASMGCEPFEFSLPFDSWLTPYDTTFQMCSPSLEYPRSDLHHSIRFAGFLPKKGIDPNSQYPGWWSEIIANAALPDGSPEKKKIVPVAQGTLATEYDEVIIPAINALSKREDVIVVALLGVRGATLPADFTVPANVRVADYIPYDAVLEYADLFITNGGYGSMMHAVNNAVPMVVAGITEDKIEVTARAEWAGFAVNLKTQTPTSEQISAAADKIFADPSYKLKAKRLQLENQDLDSIAIIEREIWRYSQ